jgi:hypothetical protein
MFAPRNFYPVESASLFHWGAYGDHFTGSPMLADWLLNFYLYYKAVVRVLLFFPYHL